MTKIDGIANSPCATQDCAPGFHWAAPRIAAACSNTDCGGKGAAMHWDSDRLIVIYQ